MYNPSNKHNKHAPKNKELYFSEILYTRRINLLKYINLILMNDLVGLHLVSNRTERLTIEGRRGKREGREEYRKIYIICHISVQYV